MSRPIKFRLWDKTRQKMFYSDGGFTGANGEIELCNIYTGYSSSDEWNDYELMQFTGLKDKDGKEIFEGDLLGWDIDDGIILEVFWHDDECEFRCRAHWVGNRCGGYIPEFKAGKTFEVIGNIFENPELLKKE